MSKAGIKDKNKYLQPADTVRCNYLSMFLIPVCGATFLILFSYSGYCIHYTCALQITYAKLISLFPWFVLCRALLWL